MTEKYVLGIDIGTSGTRAVLFNSRMDKIAASVENYELIQIKNGWAEQEPTDWFKAVKTVIKEVIRESKIDPKAIRSIGLAGQMHGLVMLDKEDEVIRPCIIWADQRTEKEVEDLNKIFGRDRLMEITANPATTGFTAAKILWVKKNEEENFNKCRKILLPKDYIRFMLTGEYATDVSDASGMQLLNIKERDWSEEIVNGLGLSLDMLGRVYESVEITGYVKKDMADELGLSYNVKVVGGAGDNAAAAIGTGVVKKGRAFTTIGTSGVVFAHTDSMKVDNKGRIHTFCSAVPGAWHVMGVTQGAGLSLKWYRENLYTGEDKNTYDLINKDIETIAIGSEKLIYLPYLMGERTPHLDPNARGVFFGLSAVHNNKHIGRSVMEGVTYSLRDSFNIIRDLDISIEDMMMTGGGAKSPLWRQMLSDNYNCKIYTISSDEGAALGAGILAAVGANFYDSVEEASDKILKIKEESYPILKNHREYNKYYKVYRQLYKDLKGTFKLLGEI